MITGTTGSLRIFPTDRPIIRETKLLRVSIENFDVKSTIGSGYFGEVNVSIPSIYIALSKFCIRSWSPINSQAMFMQ